MKCAYREVMAQEKRMNAYRGITDDFLQFLDASAGCVMHRIHGHGEQRLFDMFGGLVRAVNDAMTETTLTEEEIAPDAPESVRRIMERIQNDPKPESQLAEEAVEEYKEKLAECGFDMDAVAASVPKIDRFTRWSMEEYVETHQTRENFINNVWIIVQMYHGALLCWLRKHRKFGAERLTTTYRALLEDYYDYCGWYLRCSNAGNRTALKMTEERVKECKRIGITLER